MGCFNSKDTLKAQKPTIVEKDNSPEEQKQKEEEKPNHKKKGHKKGKGKGLNADGLENANKDIQDTKGNFKDMIKGLEEIKVGFEEDEVLGRKGKRKNQPDSSSENEVKSEAFETPDGNNKKDVKQNYRESVLKSTPGGPDDKGGQASDLIDRALDLYEEREYKKARELL